VVGLSSTVSHVAVECFFFNVIYLVVFIAINVSSTEVLVIFPIGQHHNIIRLRRGQNSRVRLINCIINNHTAVYLDRFSVQHLYRKNKTNL